VPLKDLEARRQYNKEYQRKWYSDPENKKLQISRSAESNKKRNKEYREKINDLKDTPCMDCGNRFPPVCMDFDHITDNKITDVSSMVRRNRYTWEKIQAEIDKCELVCANCHRIRTECRRRGVEKLVSR
jgi:hypothetical protein